jgi:flavin-dependent dehydrogenase
MNNDQAYDVIVIGGGLAGLSFAIQLAQKKYKILVLEKDSFPRHKVCGEYISMESQPFLERLGLPVSHMNLPIISKLQVTDTRGNEVNTSLPLGGFGISRYMLDDALASLAEKQDITVLTHMRVDEVLFTNGCFTVRTKDQVFSATVVGGAWGKRSNIDLKLQRTFILEKNNALNNYIGIKYHINYPWPADYIGLHNFANGYCGISRIEDGNSCLCYLTTAANLRESGNDLKKLERDKLMKNPVLQKIFSNAAFLYGSPLAISQISFQKREQVQQHVLLLGDAAGVITPLCGNGMSMAFRSAHIAAGLADLFLLHQITREQLETRYTAAWKNNFHTRLAIGRFVQGNFGKDRTTTNFIKTMNIFPFLRRKVMKQAAGKIF